jgi:hypothetical protein
VVRFKGHIYGLAVRVAEEGGGGSGWGEGRELLGLGCLIKPLLD